MVQDASVVDLFCGVGGMTRGFLNAGLKVVAGVDIDETCKYPFEVNNKGSKFVTADLFTYSTNEIEQLFGDAKHRVLVGCAPCQPFSNMANTKKMQTDGEDNRWRLVHRFGEIVGKIRPDVVSMENVPTLARFDKGRVLEEFLNQLKAADYLIDYNVLLCSDYGVPQTRARLVLVASRLGPIKLPEVTCTPDQYPTVKQSIGHLPKLKSGEIDPTDWIHRSRDMTPQNIARIQHSKPGGTWRDWPEELRLPCHRKETGQSYDAVYGRMRWDYPAPTLTTQFFNYGTGRFGHPEQDRALSFREGALLQTFPPDYIFDKSDDRVSNNALGRLIGNAVPVKLAEAIARSISEHLERYNV